MPYFKHTCIGKSWPDIIRECLQGAAMMKAQDGGSIGNAIGLQSLLDEPTRLASEAERLNAELESLVMDNYKVFVENLTCSVHLKLEVRYHCDF